MKIIRTSQQKKTTKLIRKTLLILILAIFCFELGSYVERSNECVIITTYGD